MLFKKINLLLINNSYINTKYYIIEYIHALFYEDMPKAVMSLQLRQNSYHRDIPTSEVNEEFFVLDTRSARAFISDNLS